jgi:hypothetical protein
MAKTNVIRWTQARAVAFEICCGDPECNRDDPIPEPKTGSFLWDKLPKEVTCPDCKTTFRVTTRPID